MMEIDSQIGGLIAEIRDDRTHGASQLARQAANVLKVAAEASRAGDVGRFLQEQQVVGKKLMAARPAMAPVANIVARLLKVVVEGSTGMDLDSIRRFTMAAVDGVVAESLGAVARIARHGSALITPGGRIMTHSYSSTVVAMLGEASTGKGIIGVTVTRSGPRSAGERMARELGSLGIAVTFIEDTAVGLCLDAVGQAVVGADRICADGAVVNGVGTYQLAVATRLAGIPLYVCCETLKFDARLKGNEVDLEEREPDEVVSLGKLPLEASVRNPSFDVTPLALVTGIVTEDGLLTPDGVIAYLKTLASPDTPGSVPP